MRCPKCGYISFDHVETCLKCKKDISGKVEVEGTTYHAAAPSFLKIPSKAETEEDNDFENEFVPDMPEQTEEGYEFSDPERSLAPAHAGRQFGSAQAIPGHPSGTRWPQCSAAAARPLAPNVTCPSHC